MSAYHYSGWINYLDKSVISLGLTADASARSKRFPALQHIGNQISQASHAAAKDRAEILRYAFDDRDSLWANLHAAEAMLAEACPALGVKTPPMRLVDHREDLETLQSENERLSSLFVRMEADLAKTEAENASLKAQLAEAHGQIESLTAPQKSDNAGDPQ